MAQPSRNGHRRAGMRLCRIGQISEICMTVPQNTIRKAARTGSITCSQIAEATTANAKPAPPVAMPPTKAPAARIATVGHERAAANAGSLNMLRPALYVSCPAQLFKLTFYKDRQNS